MSYHSNLFTTCDKRPKELGIYGWEFSCVCERCQLEAHPPSHDVTQALDLLAFLVERPGGIRESIR